MRFQVSAPPLTASRPVAGLFRGRVIYNNTVTLNCKTTIFTWWERLPAANIVAAPCCYRLSRLEAAPTKVDSLLIKVPI